MQARVRAERVHPGAKPESRCRGSCSCRDCAAHRDSRILPEARLKKAYEWLANPCQGTLWPRHGANQVHDVTALAIDGHFEQLFSALGVVRERSVRESELILAIEPTDLVEDSSAIQRPEPEVSNQHRDICPGLDR